MPTKRVRKPVRFASDDDSDENNSSPSYKKPVPFRVISETKKISTNNDAENNLASNMRPAQSRTMMCSPSGLSSIPVNDGSAQPRSRECTPTTHSRMFNSNITPTLRSSLLQTSYTSLQNYADNENEFQDMSPPPLPRTLEDLCKSVACNNS